ncbi:hypothetical protein ABEU86_23680, partial [Pseudomonas paraversuta]|uniref:hypothetical protein n=1 Tax=Pseudomonas paraversuta TaxID=2750624 RepID=UPI003D2AABEF
AMIGPLSDGTENSICRHIVSMYQVKQRSVRLKSAQSPVIREHQKKYCSQDLKVTVIQLNGNFHRYLSVVVPKFSH